MKKVAMFVWNDFLNDARVLKEAETLQANGCQVTVFALIKPEVTPAKEILGSGVVVRRVTKQPFQSKFLNKGASSIYTPKLSVGSRVAKFTKPALILKVMSRSIAHLVSMYKIIKSQPDVIHAHDANTLPTAWVASKLSRAKLIYDAHEVSTSREGYDGLRGIIYHIEKRLMPRVDGVITTTRMRAKFFQRCYKIELPLILQNRPMLSEVEKTDRIRHELKLTEEWPIVLYQGGLQQGRGLDLIIESAKDVKNAYFVFIGGGRMALELLELRDKLGLQDSVFFIDTVPLAQLPYYTASADIGLQVLENTCFNHFSTDSNKLFEYIQAGIPVVASDFPEIRKIVRDYEIGELISSGSAEDLALTLNKLVGSQDLMALYSKNAHKCKSSLSWQEQEHVLVDLDASLESLTHNFFQLKPGFLDPSLCL
jgi:glycosyltransferase involved in cell wall biosynthesis